MARTTAPVITRTATSLIVKDTEISLTRASDIIHVFASRGYERKTIEFAGSTLKFAPSREKFTTPIGTSISHPKLGSGVRVNVAGVIMDGSTLIMLANPNATPKALTQMLRGVKGVQVSMGE